MSALAEASAIAVAAPKCRSRQATPAIAVTTTRRCGMPEPVQPQSVEGAVSCQCPSETTSATPSTTLMAVSSSIA